MRIAVASDIHSNHFALEAFLAYARKEGIERLLFLGDYVSGASCPEKTMALLFDAEREFSCDFVLGNREGIMLRQRAKSPDGSDISGIGGAFLYTYKRLSEEDFAWFRKHDISKAVTFSIYPPIEMCHGTMEADNKPILPENENAGAAFASMSADVLLCGHSHRQFMLKNEDGRLVLNPGTIGWSNKAHFAILERGGGRWVPQLMSIPYDTDAAIAEMQQSGCLAEQGIWGHVMMHIIKTGIDPIHDLEAEIRRLKSEQTEAHEDAWYWDTAARNIGIVS